MRENVVVIIVAMLLLGILPSAKSAEVLRGDISGLLGVPDGAVDFLDIAELMTEWLTDSNATELGLLKADLDGNGIVDFYDFAVMSNEWFLSTPPTAVIDSIEPNPADVNTPVTLTGHGEYSSGPIAAYLWRIDDVNESNEPTFVISTLAIGSHRVWFAVQNTSGIWSEPVTQILNIKTVIPNAIPQAFIDSISPNPAKRDETITFAGYGQDSDGNIASYEWKSDSHGQLNNQASFSISAVSLGLGTHNITFRTQDNEGAWSQPATQAVTVENIKPTAYIDSITPSEPNVGNTVTFAGHGTDVDGSVVAYSWNSSIDGRLSTEASFSTTSLSFGNHIITFTVTDNDGGISTEVTQGLKVNEMPIVVIIDNDRPGSSSTGTWQVSSIPNPYGTNSLWAYNGATYTWSFTPTITAIYRISMWWTASSSRSNSVPVTIEHGGGTATVAINQQQNGGMWNSLGEYVLNAGTMYKVTLAAPSGTSSNACADAVKFEKILLPNPPVADFHADHPSGRTPLTVTFTDDSLGIITSRLWDFGDGTTSTQANPSHTYTAANTYTVSLTVSNAGGSDVVTKADYVETAINHENIYVCQIYSWNGLFLSGMDEMLSRLPAVKKDTYWLYKNVAQDITYNIRYVTTSAGTAAALAEPNSHVILGGHANYGLAASFAVGDEFRLQRIDSVRYIDDDRFLKCGSEAVSVKIDGMQIGQAYPNWQPIYKDGTRGLMPYDFSEGTPAYNYYITYHMPGDSNSYRVELMNGSYIERFPDSSVPPWYSKSGAKPDPTGNPQYFIINPEQYWSRGEVTGSWSKSDTAGIYKDLGYNGYNYLYRNAGSGANKVSFTCGINAAGRYSVSGSWFPQADHAKNAEYIINHAAGTTTVYADQTKGNTSSFWNYLGTFDFAEGEATIVATDKASSGVVIADGILLTPVDNPTNLVRAEFKASVRTGAVGLTVQFTDYSKVMKAVQSRLWDFGDGSTSDETNPSHTYTDAGIYEVSLTVTDSTGAQSTETKSNYISVGVTAPLNAEFYATGLYGVSRTTVRFYDQSIGGATKWLWDFGDGSTSTDKNPTHVYYLPRQYTVSLTISGPDGSDTHTENNYVFIGKPPIYADNGFQHKGHFYTGSASRPTPKAIVKTKGRLQDSELGYARLFLGTCNSANYYLDTFHRGIVFFTTGDIEHYTGIQYLEGYLRGLSDQDILTQVNNVQPVHEYYNFSLKPPSMRK
jgi:PKD repeat protein